MWQKHNTHLANFDVTSFACYLVSLGRIVRCGLRIVPVSSETEDKFEVPMEVTASSRLFEIASVPVRLHHGITASDPLRRTESHVRHYRVD
jgi:hypothetical protein